MPYTKAYLYILYTNFVINDENHYIFDSLAMHVNTYVFMMI